MQNDDDDLLNQEMDDIFQSSAEFPIKKISVSPEHIQMIKKAGKAHLDSVTSVTSDFGEENL